MSAGSPALTHRMSEVYQGASPNARFLAGAAPVGPIDKVRLGATMGVSMATHAAGFLLLLFVMSHLPDAMTSVTDALSKPPDVIWTAQPGPGGGGGGGGNRQPAPPPKAELPGKQKITVPVAKPLKLDPAPPKDNPKPEPAPVIPAMQTADGVKELPGIVTSLPSAPTGSQGSGTGGGYGTGNGTGIGPGSGSGLGPGSGGGTGGGVYQPGNGVTTPRLVHEVKPSYTGDAMRAKIQGVVTMEAVVNPDGTVGQVHITRSLDPTFGLDQEAVKTVKQWRFDPGRLRGQPVAVQVIIEMTFTLR
jgi:protein TonB